jgi:hypothetical protein
MVDAGATCKYTYLVQALGSGFVTFTFRIQSGIPRRSRVF